MIKLSVNVNKVATVRNSRGGSLPSVVEAALRELVEAGAKTRAAATAVSRLTGISANELYRAVATPNT